MSHVSFRVRRSSRAGGRRVALIALIAACLYLAAHPPPAGTDAFENGRSGWTVVGGRILGVRGTDWSPVAAGSLHYTPGASVAAETRVPLDLVIAFDTSGSMGRAIAEVRDATLSLVSELRQRSRDLRLGLVSFKDIEADPAEVAIETYALSADVDARLSDLKSWQAAGGGESFAEDQLAAIEEATRMAWRAGSSGARAIVVITDAPAKSPDVMGRDVNSILASVKQVPGLRVHSIVVGRNAQTLTSARSITGGTGGRVFTVNQTSELREAIIGSIDVSIAQSDPWMWRAPESLVRRLSLRAHGNVLSFDLEHDCPGLAFAADDVVLQARGLTIALSVEPVRAGHWSRYAIPLDESAPWVVLPSRRPAVREDLLQALGSLRELRIRGERCSGGASGGLDNVSLQPA